MAYIDSNDIHTTAQLRTITPSKGDILLDESKGTLVVGDGTTKGGNAMLDANGGNTTVSKTGGLTYNFLTNDSQNVYINLGSIASPTVIYGLRHLIGETALRLMVNSVNGALVTPTYTSFPSVRVDGENVPALQPTTTDGQNSKRIARVTFDYSDQATSGTYDSGVSLPDNAIVTRAWYDVVTTFAGDGDDGTTIAVQVEGANDIVTATAISAGGNVWDAGLHEGVPQGDDVTTFVKTTAARNISIVVAVGGADTSLAAGSMVLFFEYVVSD